MRLTSGLRHPFTESVAPPAARSSAFIIPHDRPGYADRAARGSCPVQICRYRDVLRTKTDDLDAYLIAGLLRSGQSEGSYVPDEQIQSLRELARLRARLMRERQNYLRRLAALLAVVFCSLAELDVAMQALLPPPDEDAGPSDAQLLQSIPGIGPQIAC